MFYEQQLIDGSFIVQTEIPLTAFGTGQQAFLFIMTDGLY